MRTLVTHGIKRSNTSIHAMGPRRDNNQDVHDQILGQILTLFNLVLELSGLIQEVANMVLYLSSWISPKIIH